MRFFTPVISLFTCVSCFAAATTQPAASAPPPQIAVFSFSNVGPAEQGWIGQAIEENFVAELSRGGMVWPVRAVADNKDQNSAMKTARNSGATYLLTGTYQIVDDELRATGQIVAVNDGHVIGGLTATGATRDLFAIEDALAMQAKRLLAPAPAGPVAAAPPIAPSGPLTTGPVVVSNDFSAAAYVPAVAYGPQYDQYYYYSTPYAYSGYGCGFPIGIGFGGSGIGCSGYGIHGGFRGGFYGGAHGHISWGGAGVVSHSGW